MRIVLIPGFAEDELIFSKIEFFIKADKIVLNSWKLLGNRRRDNFNALTFAEELISAFALTERDLLIGHSMGGWIAYHIKHLIGCRIIHIASMTNTDRIIPPVVNHPLFFWAIRKGLVFNPFTTWISSFGFYHHHYSKGIFLYCAKLLEKGNPENIVNQLKLILNRVDATITVQPDLRIHSKQDTILRPPLEPYYEVPGDHFILFTHPAEVAKPIVQFLSGL